MLDEEDTVTLHAGSTSSTVCLPFSISSQATTIDLQPEGIVDLHQHHQAQGDHLIPAGSITSVIELTPCSSSLSNNNNNTSYSNIHSVHATTNDSMEVDDHHNSAPNLQTITLSALDGTHLEHSSLPLTLSTLLPLSSNSLSAVSTSSSSISLIPAQNHLQVSSTSSSSNVSLVDTSIAMPTTSLSSSLVPFSTSSMEVPTFSNSSVGLTSIANSTMGVSCSFPPSAYTSSANILENISCSHRTFSNDNHHPDDLRSVDHEPVDHGRNGQQHNDLNISQHQSNMSCCSLTSSHLAFTMPSLVPIASSSPPSTSIPSLPTSTLVHPPTSRSPMLSISEVTNTLLEHNQ